MQRVTIYLGLAAIAVLLIELVVPWRYLAGDSFIYFTMARNVWDHGLWFSFSGIDHTTGAHPLYYFLLAFVYPIVGHLLPQASLVFNGLLLAGAVWLLYRTYGGVVAMVVAMLFLTPLGVMLTNNGMESALAILSLSLVLWIYASVHRTFKDALLLGCALGVLVLARLDSLFIALSIGALFSVRELRYGIASVPRSMVVAAAAAVTILSAILISLHYDGAVLPISGAIKSSFPHVRPDWIAHLLSLKMFIVSIVVLLGYLVFSYYRKKEIVFELVALSVGVVFLGLYNGLFVHDIGAWYGSLPFSAAALGVGLVVRDFYDYVRPYANVALPILLVGVVLTHAFVHTEDWITPHQIAAEFLNQHAGSGMNAAELKDGEFAFYAEQAVFNLTGLANTPEYQAAQRNGTVPAYLASHHIAYIVGGAFASGVQIPGATEDFSRCHDPVWQNALVAVYPVSACTY